MRNLQLLRVLKIWIILLLLSAAPAATISSHATQGIQDSWLPIPLTTPAQRAAGVKGGEGFQQVMAIAYAPSNPQIVYLSSDTSQIWKSEDGGSSWRPINVGFHSQGAGSLFVHPRNENIVFAAGYLGKQRHRVRSNLSPLQGIYRSTDGGAQWQLVHRTDFYKQESITSLFAMDLATADKNDFVIYAGTYADGLLKSKDGGITWKPSAFNQGRILDLEAKPKAPGALMVVTEKGLFLFAGGNSTPIGQGLPTWPRSISISPANPLKVYAALGPDGIHVSEDGGQTFTPIMSGLPRRIDLTDVVCSPVDANVVYAGTSLSSHPPFYSHSGGNRWEGAKSINARGLTVGKGFYFPSPFAPHPHRPLIALTCSNGKARVLRTEDGGKNWFYSGSGYMGGRMRDAVFLSKNEFIFSLTDHGIWKTTDRGRSFRDLRLPKIKGLSSRSAAISGNTLVCSVGKWQKKTLVVSHDKGVSWKKILDLQDRFDLISFHPQDATTIYAGPFRSDDGGGKWKRLNYAIRAVFKKNGDIVYSVSDNGRPRVLKSFDRGETWSPLVSSETGLRLPKVNDLTVDPQDPNRIYLATARGIFIFDGKHWRSRGHGHGLMKDYHGMNFVETIAVYPQNPAIIFAGKRSPGKGVSNGVFRSRNRGMSWENINYNLGPNLTIWSIESNPFDGSVYVGTSHGTYRLEMGL